MSSLTSVLGLPASSSSSEESADWLVPAERIKREEETAIIRQTEDLSAANPELNEDYKLVRETYRDLVKKGRQALDGAIDLAENLEKPTGFQAVAELLRSIGDTTDKLLSMHKDKKELASKPAAESPGGVPQIAAKNAVFVGSTKELQKMLAQMNSEKSE